MSQLEIRLAAPDDVETIATLIIAFRNHLAADEPADAELRDYLPRLLSDPGVEFACARLGGRAVGYSQTHFVDSIWSLGFEAFLDDLFVVKSARGRQVGRTLLRHAIDRADVRGARRFALNTNERNERAHALYRAEGLRPESQPLYADGREVRWSKKLG